MIKRIVFSLLAGCLLPVGAVADNPPAALFAVNGRSVTLDEFSRYCRQSAPSGEVPVQNCLERYIDYRLKVENAKEMGLDTLPEFKQQCAVLQGDVWKSYLLSPVRMEEACREMGQKRSGRFLSDTWVELSYVTFPLLQSASRRQEQEAMNRMTAVYDSLRQGGSFAHLSASCLSGMQVKTHVWRPMRGLLREFATQLETLKDGEVCRPFASPLGVHVVRVEGRREGIDEEKARQFWADYWEMSGDSHPALDGQRLQEWQKGQLSDVGLLGKLREVHDGLLAVYWDMRHEEMAMAGNRQPVDTRALSDYYEQHRDKYQWSLPHYKGAVIHCADKKAASRIKKQLKKLPVEAWEGKLAQCREEHPEWKAEMTSGLFRIGSNPYVDKLAFKCGELPANGTHAYSFVMGKRLNKGPEDYRDVLSQVTRDYLLYRESMRVQYLKDRYKVEIYQDVLKTVNCSGSN